MSYQSLARKYRPRRFQDMVGQDAITKALSNAIRLNRIPQGVIFSGVRGIGKTTTARLYAKALNCVNGPTSDPCNQCDSCVAINEGIHEDVLEIDGASNTSVDDVRALQETLDYVPQRSSYKVYIIDEVHMLSQSAFNALLKTLEEPPQHVVFSFATTELQKVPETILSRCQTFHLKRLSLSTIVARLQDILNSEGVQFEEHAIVAVAKEGRGSMRDSLTFLDQVIALGDGCVSADSLKGLINTASSKSYITLLDSLVARDAERVLSVVDQWDEKGVPLDDAVEEVAKFARHGFVLKELGSKSIDTNLLGLAPSELEYLHGVADKSPNLDLNRIFRTLVKCRKDLDGSELDRFVLENYCLEWCLDPGLPSLDELRNMSVTGATAKNPVVNKSDVVETAAPRSSSSNLKAKWANAFGQNKAPEEAKSPHKSEELQSPGIQEASPNNVAEEIQAPVTSPAPVRPPEVERSKLDINRETKSPAPTPNLETPQPPPIEVETKLADPEVVESQEPKGSANPDSKVSVLFPDSWRDLVGIWKSKKPLQGRILEETVPLEYSEQMIRVAVDPGSMAGAKLLHPDHRKRVLDGIRELFGFSGQLVVDEKGSGDAQGAEHAAESLLQVRQKEEEKARQDLYEELKAHPITKEALNVFDGKINTINMLDA